MSQSIQAILTLRVALTLIPQQGQIYFLVLEGLRPEVPVKVPAWVPPTPTAMLITSLRFKRISVRLFSTQNSRRASEGEVMDQPYCRVSTIREEQLGSLENQIAYYTHYISDKPGWRLVSAYYDRASGMRVSKRTGYQRMLKDCAKGKIDLILVKSVSRFGKDALEVIRRARKLKEMGIDVYFETGGINTMTADNIILDTYAAFSQAESQALSDNIKFGIRQRMRSGKTVLNHTQFLGYTKGKDGVLSIVPEEAEVVKKIYDLYLQGNGVRKIKRYLENNCIKTVTGKAEWSTSTIDRMLSNEKYIGQVLMQKTYIPDFLTGKQEKNKGELTMYLIENAHEPIIDRETFERVQEMKRHVKISEEK